MAGADDPGSAVHSCTEPRTKHRAFPEKELHSTCFCAIAGYPYEKRNLLLLTYGHNQAHARLVTRRGTGRASAAPDASAGCSSVGGLVQETDGMLVGIGA